MALIKFSSVAPQSSFVLADCNLSLLKLGRVLKTPQGVKYNAVDKDNRPYYIKGKELCVVSGARG